MVERPETVRLAEPPDENALYRLLLLLEKDNTLGYPHDEDIVRQRIRIGTEKKGGHIGVIDAPDRPGELAASISVEWNSFWYSAQHYLVEQWLFVDPAYRKGTGYADDLMRWAAWIHERYEIAAERKIPMFTSVTSRHRLKAKARWWARRGELVGQIFLLR